jgi:hypothetical protein
MLNYDTEKKIASITTDPLKFDIVDLVGTIQMALDNALDEDYNGRINDMSPEDYRELCNLIFENAKY